MISVRHEVLDRIDADLLTWLRANAGAAELDRRLPAQTAARLRDVGVMRLLQPARVGGYEADPQVFYEAVRRIGTACGSSRVGHRRRRRTRIPSGAVRPAGPGRGVRRRPRHLGQLALPAPRRAHAGRRGLPAERPLALLLGQRPQQLGVRRCAHRRRHLGRRGRPQQLVSRARASARLPGRGRVGRDGVARYG